jgi:hypothetical protein
LFVYTILIMISIISAILRILISISRNEIFGQIYGVCVGLFGVVLFFLCAILVILTIQLYVRFVKFQTTSLDFVKLRVRN